MPPGNSLGPYDEHNDDQRKCERLLISKQTVVQCRSKDAFDQTESETAENCTANRSEAAKNDGDKGL